MFDVARACSALALIVVAAPLSFANGIRVADNPALPTFTSLQAAIDAAPDGGLLLVQTGFYGASVIDGKSLSIVAMPGSLARTTQPMRIQNLTSTQRVSVSGMDMRGATNTQQPDSVAVILTDNVGAIRFESCATIGGWYHVTGSDVHGGPAVRVQASSQVVFSNCHMQGGDSYADLSAVGVPGGQGITSTDSYVVLYDCDVRGGLGSVLGWPGGDGGIGCEVSGWGLFASGTLIHGGMGGYGDDVGCTDGGVGGDGVRATGAQVFLLDDPIAAGQGGFNGCSPAQTPGIQIHVLSGAVHQLAGTRRKLAAATIAADNALLTVTVTGQPGDRFYLAGSWDTAFAYQSAWNGMWTIPPQTAPFARAIVPPSGTLVMQVRSPNLTSLDHRLEFLQGFCVDTAGQRTLTGPVQVEVLDAQGGPDCDSSGVNDFVQLIGGALDCNRNVELDTCDISSGTSQDLNQNGIPDECTGG